MRENLVKFEVRYELETQMNLYQRQRSYQESRDVTAVVRTFLNIHSMKV